MSIAVDTNGNVTQVADTAGRLVRVKDAENGVSYAEYDNAGRKTVEIWIRSRRRVPKTEPTIIRNGAIGWLFFYER